MPKKLTKEDYRQIEDTIKGCTAPLSIDEIMGKLPKRMPRRTLQRRLAWLAGEKRIESIGLRRGTRYKISSTISPQKEQKQNLNSSAEQIPLSKTGIEIFKLITRPVTSRTPVGYQFSFLEDYVPNSTQYLNKPIRDELWHMGQVGVSKQPAGTYLRQLLDRLLIDLSWNSSRLEGNTYSLLETERLIQIGENAEGKEARDTQMILNHKGAIEMIADQAEEIGFNTYTICNLHALLSDNLLSDPGACGRVRSRAVAITGTIFLPLGIPQSIEEHFQLLLKKADQIKDPFEQAFFIMVHIPYLQPFEDVNKRVSRLAANIPLVKLNLCPLSFVDVPQRDYINGTIAVYELNRVEYLRDVFIWAYQRSCARYSAIQQSLGQPDPLRVKFRLQIKKAVSDIIKNEIHKKNAPGWIVNFIDKSIPNSDKSKVMEIIENELRSLHEGSIARYGLRLTEYSKWKKKWV